MSRNRLLYRAACLMIIASFLYQDVLWAQKNLAPASGLERYFKAKGIYLSFHVTSRLFFGFNAISEKVFQPGHEGDLYKEIIRIFPEGEGLIGFKKDSIRLLTENGNPFFMAEAHLLQSNISLDIVFYDPYRPPLRYLRERCITWSNEDEAYAREKGFWIVLKGYGPPEESVDNAVLVKLMKGLRYFGYHAKRRLYVLWSKYNPYIFSLEIARKFVMFFKMAFSRRYREDYISKMIKKVLVKGLNDQEIDIDEIRELRRERSDKAVSSFVFLISLIIMNEFVTAPAAGAFVLALPIPLILKIPLVLISGGSIRAIGMLIAKFIYPDLNISKAILVTLPKWIGIPWSLSYIMRSYNYNFRRVISRNRVKRFREIVDSIIERRAVLDVPEGRKAIVKELSAYGSASKGILLLRKIAAVARLDPQRVSIYKNLIRLLEENSVSLVVDFGVEKISAGLLDNEYGLRCDILKQEIKGAYSMADVEGARSFIIEKLRMLINSAIQVAGEKGLIIDDVIVTMEGLTSFKTGSIDYSTRFRAVERVGFRELVDDIIKESGIQERRIYFVREGHAAVLGERYFGRHSDTGLFYIGLNTSLRAGRIGRDGEVISQTEFGYLYNVGFDGKRFGLNDLAGRRRLVNLASRLARLAEYKEDYNNFIKRYDIKGQAGLSKLRQAFKDGDLFAVKLYAAAAGYIGDAIVMALVDGTIKDTDTIVIGGDLLKYGLAEDDLEEVFIRKIRRVVGRRFPDTARSIVVSKMGNEREMRGAKYYARNRIEGEKAVQTSLSGGASKNIGPPMDIVIPEETRQRWSALAKGVEVKQYSHGISAKVFQVDDLSKGLNAWHFRDGEDLVIVTRMPPMDEIVYHEYREDYWMGLGLSQRDSHILASAEQVLMFSVDGKPTPYHQSQLENVIVDEDRSYHWQVILKYLGAEILERVKEYEMLFRTRACQAFLERTVRSSNTIAGEVARLSGMIQRIKGVSILQFAVPIGVLKSAGDFALVLRKMGLLGNTKFELIIYDLDSELDGDKFIRKLDLPKNIRVYGITKTQAGDIRLLKDFIRRRYPLRDGRDGYLMIATDLVNSESAQAEVDSLKTNLEENVSLRVIVRPDETSVILLSNILSSWLADLGSSIKIILPLPVSPQELKRRLEEEMLYLWEFLVSA